MLFVEPADDDAANLRVVIGEAVAVVVVGED
jgi:hypothetical protein